MILKFFGPLTQFDVSVLPPCFLYSLLQITIGFSEFDLVILLVSCILYFWQWVDFFNEEGEDNVINFDEELMLIDSVSSKNYNYIILINFFFTTIFICNFAGLFPYSQTVTAQIAFTFAFSILIILTIWFNSFFSNKILIFNHFLPNGSPLVIIPFIILIELVSNLSRIISLAVRLFANITSGHALLKILAGFTIAAFTVVGVWKGLFLVVWVIILVITGLEILIAFLQTYVFVTLVLIYVSEQE